MSAEMSDLIERQAAIDKLDPFFESLAIDKIKALPSAQPDLNQWCTDCKEYDPEKHHCPRYNRVIREALKNAQSKKIDFDLVEKINNAYDSGYETGYLQGMHDWGNMDE